MEQPDQFSLAVTGWGGWWPHWVRGELEPVPGLRVDMLRRVPISLGFPCSELRAGLLSMGIAHVWCQVLLCRVGKLYSEGIS